MAAVTRPLNKESRMRWLAQPPSLLIVAARQAANTSSQEPRAGVSRANMPSKNSVVYGFAGGASQPGRDLQAKRSWRKKASMSLCLRSFVVDATLPRWPYEGCAFTLAFTRTAVPSLAPSWNNC